jgi:hypothetical protein
MNGSSWERGSLFNLKQNDVGWWADWGSERKPRRIKETNKTDRVDINIKGQNPRGKKKKKVERIREYT